jgi:hypothetical protein
MKTGLPGLARVHEAGNKVLPIASTRSTFAPALPANVDAERMVLGSILLDCEAFSAACTELSPEDFSLEKHRVIFRRIADLHDRGEHIDRVTVYNELGRHGAAASRDLLSYLLSLDEGLPRLPNIRAYVLILKEKAALRKIILGCSNLAQRASVAAESSADITAAAHDLFVGIAARVSQSCPRIPELPGVVQCCAAEVEYMRNPELPKGAVAALTGDSGSGKSTLAFAWARDAGVPVLVLDRENPISVVRERMERLRLLDGPNLRVWGGWLPEEAPLPGSPIVLDWVKACEVKPLVIIDSLSAFFCGDQNDATEMRSFMHGCRRLADLGATPLILHHDGKAETAKDYRGSSDFKAAVDQAFHVSNFGDDGRLNKLVLRCFKSRFGLCGELTYKYAGGQFTHEDATCTRETITDALVSLLRTNPGVTSRKFEELANARGLGRNRARSFLEEGVLSGSVRREPGSRNQKRHCLASSEASDQR